MANHQGARAGASEQASLRQVLRRASLFEGLDEPHMLESEGDSEQIVDLGVSKTQLSAAVGTVPETLPRAFQQLSSSGAVETRGRKVLIKDRALLQRVARVK